MGVEDCTVRSVNSKVSILSRHHDTTNTESNWLSCQLARDCEQITGVRLVFTYGISVPAGHVEIKGGTLPLHAQMTVRIVREGA